MAGIWRCLIVSSGLLAGLAGCGSPGEPASTAQRAQALLERAPLVDGHNDLLVHYLGEDGEALGDIDGYDIRQRTSGQVDVPRMKAGRLGAAIFTVGINDTRDREAAIAASTTLLRDLAARSGDDLEVVVDADGLERAFSQGRIAMLMGLEGGDQIGGSLDVLRATHRHGVRAMTLTWERSNEIGDANADAAKHGGLSPFGADVVREMNRLGMLVDLSHAADATASDVLDIAAAPVILSHSSARALTPSPRNVPDDLLRRIARNGGLVMVTFVGYFTTPAYLDWYVRGEAHWAELKARHDGEREAMLRDMALWDERNPRPVATVGDVADHIEHVRRVAGIDHVGIGGDFDGMGEFVVTGLEDVSTYPALFEELLRRGWSDEDLRKLAGGNFLRVLREVEAAAQTAG